MTSKEPGISQVSGSWYDNNEEGIKRISPTANSLVSKFAVGSVRLVVPVLRLNYNRA